MEFDLKKARELSYISKLCGQDERLVQAGGGNTSVKLDDRYMLVKASGYHLTDVTEQSGYAVADYRLITDIFSGGEVDDNQEAAILSKALTEGGRPSIETFLHSVTGRYTIHTHPLGVTMYAAAEGGMERLSEMFPDSVAVEYATPGIKLAKKYYAAVKSKPDAKLIFLKNHGMLVSADTPEDALELHTRTVKKIDESLGLDTAVYDTSRRLFEALQEIQPGLIAYQTDTQAVNAAVERAGGAWGHAYSPDCVVYGGGSIAVLKNDFVGELRKHKEKYGMAKAALADGYVFAIAENMKAARDIACILDFSAKVYLSGKGRKLIELDSAERAFLLNWDSEKYRASLKN